MKWKSKKKWKKLKRRRRSFLAVSLTTEWFEMMVKFICFRHFISLIQFPICLDYLNSRMPFRFRSWRYHSYGNLARIWWWLNASTYKSQVRLANDISYGYGKGYGSGNVYHCLSSSSSALLSSTTLSCQPTWKACFHFIFQVCTSLAIFLSFVKLFGRRTNCKKINLLGIMSFCHQCLLWIIKT